LGKKLDDAPFSIEVIDGKEFLVINTGESIIKIDEPDLEDLLHLLINRSTSSQ